MAAVARFENGRLVYEPDEMLEIRWADAIAAHNAAQALLTILKDKDVELPEYLDWSTRNWLPTAVAPGRRDDVADTLPDREAAIAWLTELRGRLREVLPWPERSPKTTDLLGM